MEDVLGGYSDDSQFANFLGNWAVILNRRVDEVAASFSQVHGLHGLILAGGLGRGQPWPLSDIDLIPIYDDDRLEAAAAEIETRRVAFLERWVAEGWWSGLDIGRLRFTTSEVQQVLQAGSSAVNVLLADDRWYHSIDKAFGGHALMDAEGLASGLAAWFTAPRFTAEVVTYRLHREERELRSAQGSFAQAVASGEMLTATRSLRDAMKWLITLYLERWRQRDNSQGRLGTRFVTAAQAHGAEALVDAVHALSDLTEPQVWRRLEAAPRWVRERHDRSLRARLHIGEPVTALDDARDTLRVCSLYGLRCENVPPYPAWLAVMDMATARARVEDLERTVQHQQ